MTATTTYTETLTGPFGLGNHDFFADPARDQLSCEGMQSTTRTVPGPARVQMRFGQQPQHGDVIVVSHRGK
jgi:hypothetical protein